MQCARLRGVQGIHCRFIDNSIWNTQGSDPRTQETSALFERSEYISAEARNAREKARSFENRGRKNRAV